MIIYLQLIDIVN